MWLFDATVELLFKRHWRRTRKGNAYVVLAPKVGTKKEPTMTPPRMTRLRGRLQKDMVGMIVRCSKVPNLGKLVVAVFN